MEYSTDSDFHLFMLFFQNLTGWRDPPIVLKHLHIFFSVTPQKNHKRNIQSSCFPSTLEWATPVPYCGISLSYNQASGCGVQPCWTSFHCGQKSPLWSCNVMNCSQLVLVNASTLVRSFALAYHFCTWTHPDSGP